AERGRDLGADDVVILPAFGITVGEMEELSRRGCTLVDTTCGSVLNVWKNVVRYAQEGFTAIIHGKMKHEETRATSSCSIAAKRRSSATTSAAAATARPSSRASARRSRPASTPTRIWTAS